MQGQNEKLDQKLGMRFYSTLDIQGWLTTLGHDHDVGMQVCNLKKEGNAEEARNNGSGEGILMILVVE